MMEKSKTFPDYPASYVRARYGLEEDPKSYSFNGPNSNAGVDDFGIEGNPELKRKKRVASYNMYATEGKLKSSLLNTFKWIKNKFTNDYFDA